MRITTRSLRQWFAEAVDANYYKWLAKRAKRRHGGSRFRVEITRYGHVNASIKMMRSKSNTRAVTKNPRTMGLEWIVLRPVFESLFPKDVLKEARRRVRLHRKWEASQ